MPEVLNADARPEERPATRRIWPWVTSGVGVLVLLVGLIWVAGGFEQRTDVKTDVAAGTTLTTGPYELTFTRATIQKTKNYSDELLWTVVVDGTGRTTGDASISPDYDDMFVAKDAASGVTHEATGQRFGTSDLASRGASFFTPGLPAIPYRVTIEFPAGAFQPTDTIQFAVFDLEWRDVSLLGNGDFRWARTSDFYRYELPLQRLPDDLD